MPISPEISRKAVSDLVWFIISFSLSTNFALILLDGGIPLRVFRFAVVVGLCLFMLKQANWARYALAIMYAISGVNMLINTIPSGFNNSFFWGMWFIAMTCLYCTITYKLAFSPKVTVYFER